MPADILVTELLPGKTVAIAVLALLHVPPVVPSLSDIDAPAHAVAGPAIAEGNGSTEISLEILQPAPIE